MPADPSPPQAAPLNVPIKRILITGANGNLGRQLVQTLCAEEQDGPRVRALVRSERAAALVRSIPVKTPPEIVIGDYTSPESMREACADCDGIVHLVGIIKEGGGGRYEIAHEATCEVLADAARRAGAQRIVYLSIFGSGPDSPNRCLASKGRAERILLEGEVPATVLRVPMVLGRGDFASAALRREATSGFVTLVGGGATFQQPVDARDVIAAILSALRDASGESLELDLGGPERLRHRDLVRRAALLHGRSPKVVPIPLAAARLLAGVLERVLSNPPITPAMLEILQHDDRIDEAAAYARLDLSPTPLDETLRFCVGPESAE
jgi:uncharacterized protein YbjT (DUF2867 family)